VITRKPLVPRDAFYTLSEKDGRILLERRPDNASLMAGMWQLPELAEAPLGAKPLCTLKHSITVTNYTVRVYETCIPLKNEWTREWVTDAEAAERPLTGLARKVLRRLRPDLAQPRTGYSR
jgi:A/G-specific adenine glycosylase